MKKYTFITFFTPVLILLLGLSPFAATRTSSQSGHGSVTGTWDGNSVPKANNCLSL